MDHPSSFGRALALVALGLLAGSQFARVNAVEHRPGAHFAGATRTAAVVPPVFRSRPGRPAPSNPTPVTEVVLKVRPLAVSGALAGTWADDPPLDPPPYALLIPVAGITPDDLTDTFGAARGSTRIHRAIDILAPTGTPVIAAVDGHVIRTHTSDLGGLTVYQVGPDSAWVFYYAHLDRYADGLHAAQEVTQGDTLGFVGATGNAPVPHLHFAVWKARPGSTRIWGGRAINPYPLLAR